jgi:hypothetical protein
MPGPSPLYRPKFSRSQLAEARELVRKRRVPHALVRRAQLVLLLAEEPTISNPEAGEQLGIHENTVRYWRQRWATEGFVLEDRPRPGRPPKFSPSGDCGDQGDRL